MCGIIGYTGKKNAVSIILEGLKRLEYRGYDSAGIAFFNERGVEIRKCTGKIKDLYAIIDSDKPFSATAIGHTRWATHGKPSEEKCASSQVRRDNNCAQRDNRKLSAA